MPPNPQISGARRPFLYSIHYFRAFAILNVVMLHAWVTPTQGRFPEAASFVEHVRENFFHGATFYFLFISGFLFHYLSSDFQLKRFYKGKVSFVLVPYILLSTVILISYALPMMTQGRVLEGLWMLGLALLKGTAQPQYWYIPYILSLYLLSPLLLRIPPKILTWIALASALLPLLGTRTGTALTLGQYVYFTPAYLGGIAVSMNFDACLVWLRKWAWVLWGIGLDTMVWIYIAGDMCAQRSSFYEALQYLNKMALTLAILELLTRNESRWSKILDSVATLSFALYFLHLIKSSEIARWVNTPIMNMMPTATPWGVVVIVSLILTVIRLGALVVLCAGLKRVLGRFSRYVIGA